MALDELTQERIARNDATFRAANERIAETAEYSEMATTGVPFICECADRDCVEIVRLSLDEYESVRSDSRHFLNLPGHEVADRSAGKVVEQNGTFVVVEKLDHAGEVAERLDKRRQRDERLTGSE